MKALLLTSAAVLVSTSAIAADYQVDPAHSFVTFEVGHLGVSTTAGRFNEFEATCGRAYA